MVDRVHEFETPKSASKKKMCDVNNSELSSSSIHACSDLHKSPKSTQKPPEIKDFHVIKPISRGAFGKVFLGYKKCNPQKLFAIKVMKKSEMINKNMVHQVNRERNALALSRSPYCVQLFYSLQTSSFVFLVMEYLIGGDLKSLLSVFGFFGEQMATFYVAEIILALQYLHQHGIIHRDIKPDNMLLTAEGHVRLTDFGLSHIPNHKDLEVSDLVNTSPDYLISRTPGQLLSLTSHLSFGSTERIKRGPESEASSSEIWSSQHNFSGIDAMPSVDESNPFSQNTDTYFTCTTCSNMSNDCDCKAKLDESFKLKRSYLGNCSNTSGKENCRKRNFNSMQTSSPSCHTGLTEQLNMMDVTSMFHAATPKRICKRMNTSVDTMSSDSPLKSVLKKRFSVDLQNRFVVSTPVNSGMKKSNSDTISLKKKTRFNLEQDPNSVTSDIEEPPLSPIVTPKYQHNSTPIRTPKSVRKGKNITSNALFGTPDYLAPELIRNEDHGSAVDWWALGVCMYEFMIGIPPFSDETVNAVFKNILELILEWPEGDESLSNEAQSAIESLLVLEPANRATGDSLRRFPLFDKTDWNNLHSIKPPFIPQPDGNMDTSYFKARNELQNLKVSEFDL